MPQQPSDHRKGASAPQPANRRRALRLGAGWSLLGLEGLGLASQALRGMAMQPGASRAMAAAAGLGLASGAAQGAALSDAAPLPAELQEALPAAQALGAARLRFLGLEIYQARLWAVNGFKASAWVQSPFALELVYARALSGRLIAERSLKEMRRQATPDAQQQDAWLAAMVQAFPDVKAGDRITGLHQPGVGARFWFNGQPRPSPGLRDAEFSRLFFGIWLSDASSEPQMRDSLLGRSS
jgi:hypothetical protein